MLARRQRSPLLRTALAGAVTALALWGCSGEVLPPGADPGPPPPPGSATGPDGGNGDGGDSGPGGTDAGKVDGGAADAGPRPDAVFAYNDAAALAALRVCHAHGLRVPDDVAIVGFDDIPAAAHATPPLSTIAVDKEALGRRGIELLLEEAPAESEVRLPVNLVVRASTSVNPS